MKKELLLYLLTGQPSELLLKQPVKCILKLKLLDSLYSVSICAFICLVNSNRYVGPHFMSGQDPVFYGLLQKQSGWIKWMKGFDSLSQSRNIILPGIWHISKFSTRFIHFILGDTGRGLAAAYWVNDTTACCCIMSFAVQLNWVRTVFMSLLNSSSSFNPVDSCVSKLLQFERNNYAKTIHVLNNRGRENEL